MVKAPGGGLTTNTWDYENKLPKVILPSGTRNTFAYDADGKRVKKEDSSGTSKFVWDRENILLETNNFDVSQAVHTLEPHIYGNLISQYRSATTNFFHFDGLGSTDRLTNINGTVTDNYLYKAFGIVLVSGGSTSNPFTYVGRLGYYLEPDLADYYIRARYLSSKLGRFISRDTLLFAAGDINLFAYVRNLPSFAIDPMGRQGKPIRLPGEEPWFIPGLPQPAPKPKGRKIGDPTKEPIPGLPDPYRPVGPPQTTSFPPPPKVPGENPLCKAKKVLCDFVTGPLGSDLVTCACFIANVIDLFPVSSNLVEYADCACNAVQTAQLFCKGTYGSCILYGGLTYADCKSLAVGTELGAIAGLPWGLGGAITGAFVGSKVGDPALDLLAFLWQNYIVRFTKLCPDFES